MMPTKTFCTLLKAGLTSSTLSRPCRFWMVAGASSVVIVNHDTRPARADVPSVLFAMPIETPTANSSGMLSSSAPPAAPRKADTVFAPPAAELIQ